MKAFIFDLDGVIVFTDKFHYQAWKKWSDEMGIYFDETINNRLRGVSRAESLELFWNDMKASAFGREKSGIDGAEKQYISGTVGNNDTGGRIGRGKRDFENTA